MPGVLAFAPHRHLSRFVTAHASFSLRTERSRRMDQNLRNRRVVVTGMGTVTPIGNTLEEFWEGLLSGRSGAAPITRFDATDFDTKFACEVKNFDGVALLGRKQVNRTDLFAQFAIVATD